MSVEADAQRRAMDDAHGPYYGMYLDAMESRTFYMDSLATVLAVPGVDAAIKAHKDAA